MLTIVLCARCDVGYDDPGHVAIPKSLICNSQLSRQALRLAIFLSIPPWEFPLAELPKRCPKDEQEELAQAINELVQQGVCRIEWRKS